MALVLVESPSMISVEENSLGFFVERKVLAVDTARFVPLFVETAEFARRLANRPGLHWNRHFEVWGGRRNKKGFGGFASGLPPAARLFCLDAKDDGYQDLSVAAIGWVDPPRDAVGQMPPIAVSIVVVGGLYTAGATIEVGAVLVSYERVNELATTRR